MVEFFLRFIHIGCGTVASKSTTRSDVKEHLAFVFALRLKCLNSDECAHLCEAKAPNARF